MMPSPSILPMTRDLVLVGGGHTHALVLRRWGMNPLPGVRVTVINPAPTAPYSGMLPGHLAGHYTRDALDIDLMHLAQVAGARIILGAAEGLDPDRRRIHVPGRPPIAFDFASLDIGVTSEMPHLPGFSEHGWPAKPLGPFAAAWDRFRKGTGPARIVVLGGGVAGAEVAMALSHAMQARARRAEVTLIDRSTALSGLPQRTARRLRAALEDQTVTLMERAEVVAVAADHVRLGDGRRIAADFTCGATGATPYRWLQDTGLVLYDGFIAVDSRLRSSCKAVFAVGDCAHLSASPRPKAGVYAVRQAPVLFDNLRAALSGGGGQRPYRAQKDYLKLVSLGRKAALGERGGLALQGPAVWRLKDRIDRSFMARFRDLPAPSRPVLPWPRAAGSAAALGPHPLCGGCGSKIGQAALSRALARLGQTDAGTGEAPLGDDAAIVQSGSQWQVLSTDHLRAFVEDPVVMTRIAVTHALGDIWAMGAEPQIALAQVILPRLAPDLAERTLTEITQTARACLGDAGAQLGGGHSTQGAEMTIGFSVTGLRESPPIRISGARPGAALVLTKPLGSGVIMAAHMRRRVSGVIVASALERMCQPQGSASARLTDAQAMTDITGFGLAGHLARLCAASGTGARVDLAQVPFLPGAEALARAGIRSSLFAENRAILPDLRDDPRIDLLFDPQTAGGLLAAVSGDADAVLADLTAAGYEAACIGRVTDRRGQIDIV